MRSISNIRKFKTCEMPELVLTIDSIDYSDNLVDIQNLRIDKKLESVVGQLEVQDLTLYLYDPNGLIEDALNNDAKDMILKLKIDSEEVTLFKGTTLPDMLQREGKKLAVKCVTYLKALEDTKLSTHFTSADDLPYPVSIDKALWTIFPDSTTIEQPLYDIDSTRAILSILQGSPNWSSAQNPELSREKSSILVYDYDGASTYKVAFAHKKSIEIYTISINDGQPQVTFNGATGISNSSNPERIKLCAYKNNKIYLAYSDADGTVYVGYYDLTTSSFTFWGGIKKGDTISGYYINVDPELYAFTFDTNTEKFVFILSQYIHTTNKVRFSLNTLGSSFTLSNIRTDDVSYLSAWGYVWATYAWGSRNDDNSKFILVFGTEGWAGKYLYDGSSWSFTELSNFGVDINTTSFTDASGIYFIGNYLGSLKKLDAISDTVTDLGLRVTDYTTSLGWADGSNSLSNAVLFNNVLRSNYSGRYLVRITASSINYVEIEHIETTNLQILTFPVAYATYLFNVGLIRYYKDGYEGVRPFIGFYSQTKRLPWFILHADNVEQGTRRFVEQAALYAGYLIEYDSVTSIKARKRIIGDSPVLFLTQNDYARLPEMQYDRLIKGVKIKTYYGEGEYELGDCGSLRYRLDIDNPFAYLTQSIFVGRWYQDNYGQPNGIFRLTTRNIVSIEEMDVISFTDHLGREQTGVVIGTQYEYPHKYTVIVHSKTVETEATEPDLPPPEPSPPEWQNVTITTTRLRPGANSIVRVTVQFEDSGGLPIEKVKMNFWRVTRDTNDDATLDEEDTMEVVITRPGSGTHTVRFFIQARYDETIGGYVYGVDRLGRKTTTQSFSVSSFTPIYGEVAQLNTSGQITVQSIGETLTNTIGISDVYNPAFDDEDNDGYPDGWSITLSGDISFSLGETSAIGKHNLIFTVPAGQSGTAVVVTDLYLPVADTIHKLFALYAKCWGAVDRSDSISIRILAYDSNKNLIDTLDYSLGSNIEDWTLLEKRVDDYLGSNVRYIRAGFYLSLQNLSVSSDVNYSVAYFLMMEPYRLDFLQPKDDLDMQNNKIVSLADPSSSQDAATKNYVDTKDPQLKVYDSSTRPTCNASNVGMMILYNYSDVNNDYQDVQVCMGDDTNGYGWETIYTKTWPKE